MIELSTYNTVVFDWDGVILDSNRIKTEAFRTATLPWGVAAAQALVAHRTGPSGPQPYLAYSVDVSLFYDALSGLSGNQNGKH